MYRSSLIATALLCALPLALAQAADLRKELLIFGSAEIARTSGLEAEDVNIDEEKIAADLLFSVERGSLRLFGEYLVTNHEADLERFQIGWEPSDRTVVWFGRFHQASSVWNHEHHHGQFLQTTITRPAIEEWEDEGGIVPQHFFGFLSESNWHLPGGHGLHTAFGGGVAPVITAGGLVPFDVIHPDFDGHQVGFQARATFLPDELGESGFGVLLAHNKLNWVDSPGPALPQLDRVNQTVVGLYGTYDTAPWKFNVAAYHVAATLIGLAGQPRDQFLVAYAQLERLLPHNLTAFARLEDSANTSDAVYLRLFPHFVPQRSTLGARWQMARKHALTLQVSDSRTRLDRFREYRVQWSAALP